MLWCGKPLVRRLLTFGSFPMCNHNFGHRNGFFLETGVLAVYILPLETLKASCVTDSNIHFVTVCGINISTAPTFQSSVSFSAWWGGYFSLQHINTCFVSLWSMLVMEKATKQHFNLIFWCYIVCCFAKFTLGKERCKTLQVKIKLMQTSKWK